MLVISPVTTTNERMYNLLCITARRKEGRKCEKTRKEQYDSFKCKHRSFTLHVNKINFPVKEKYC